jgi:hypothetical protein
MFLTTPIDNAQLTRALHSAYEGIRPEPGFLQSARFVIWQFIQNLFAAAESALSGASGIGKILIWLIPAAAIAVAGWAIVWLLRRVGLVPERSSGRPDPSLDSVDWEAEADKALLVGDLIGATKALYRQLVITLMKKGWLIDRPGLTAGECRMAVRELPGIFYEVQAATRAFERVTYGKRAAAEADVEALRLAERLVLAAPSRAAQPRNVA